MEYLDLIQWPAMAVTVWASWLVASEGAGRRNAGFWIFLISNALWITWGLHSHAYALIALQVCLAFMNIRGAVKTEPGTDSGTQAFRHAEGSLNVEAVQIERMFPPSQRSMLPVM